MGRDPAAFDQGPRVFAVRTQAGRWLMENKGRPVLGWTHVPTVATWVTDDYETAADVANWVRLKEPTACVTEITPDPAVS